MDSAYSLMGGTPSADVMVEPLGSSACWNSHILSYPCPHCSWIFWGQGYKWGHGTSPISLALPPPSPRLYLGLQGRGKAGSECKYAEYIFKNSGYRFCNLYFFKYPLYIPSLGTAWQAVIPLDEGESYNERETEVLPCQILLYPIWMQNPKNRGL